MWRASEPTAAAVHSRGLLGFNHPKAGSTELNILCTRVEGAYPCALGDETRLAKLT